MNTLWKRTHACLHWVNIWIVIFSKGSLHLCIIFVHFFLFFIIIHVIIWIILILNSRCCTKLTTSVWLGITVFFSVYVFMFFLAIACCTNTGKATILLDVFLDLFRKSSETFTYRFIVLVLISHHQISCISIEWVCRIWVQKELRQEYIEYIFEFIHWRPSLIYHIQTDTSWPIEQKLTLFKFSGKVSESL